MKALVLAVVALVALAATSCGGSNGSEDEVAGVEDVLAAVEGLDADARAAKLLELAAEEGGELTWWYGFAKEKGDEIGAAFQADHGIEVTGFDSDSGDIVLRLTEEAAAGTSTADIVYVPLAVTGELAADALLAPYAPPGETALPPSALEGGRVGTTTSVIVLAWNTDLVEPEDVPTQWEDLADPRWKGQLALDPNDVEWYHTLFTRWVQQGRSEDEAQRLFEQIASNAVFIRGRVAGAQLLGSGDVAVAVNVVSALDSAASDGAPVSWRPPVEPLVVGFTGPSIPLRTPHPAAAVLFADWLTSQEGQAVLEAAELTTAAGLATLGVDYAPIDVEQLGAESDEWQTRFERLVSLGASIEAPS